MDLGQKTTFPEIGKTIVALPAPQASSFIELDVRASERGRLAFASSRLSVITRHEAPAEGGFY